MQNQNEVPPLQPPEETLKQTAAFLENSRIMNEIVREMKEIAELPSEIPSDTHSLKHVEFPTTGGVLTWMEGYDEPYRGFPFYEFVEKIDGLKKILRGALSSLFHTIKKQNKFKLFGFFLSPWLFRAVLKGGLNASHRVISRFTIKPLRYSESIRELYRVLNLEFIGETAEDKEVRRQVRDIACMILENDNAYRFRFQDVLPELNKENLVKHPRKEIVRLLTLMQDREKTQEIKDTWTLVKTFLPTFLFFNRKIQHRLVAIMSELDLGTIKLSKEDRYFCKERKDYQFGFLL